MAEIDQDKMRIKCMVLNTNVGSLSFYPFETRG